MTPDLTQFTTTTLEALHGVMSERIRHCGRDRGREFAILRRIIDINNELTTREIYAAWEKQCEGQTDAA